MHRRLQCSFQRFWLQVRVLRPRGCTRVYDSNANDRVRNYATGSDDAAMCAAYASASAVSTSSDAKVPEVGPYWSLMLEVTDRCSSPPPSHRQPFVPLTRRRTPGCAANCSPHIPRLDRVEAIGKCIAGAVRCNLIPQDRWVTLQFQTQLF